MATFVTDRPRRYVASTQCMPPLRWSLRKFTTITGSFQVQTKMNLFVPMCSCHLRHRSSASKSLLTATPIYFQKLPPTADALRSKMKSKKKFIPADLRDDDHNETEAEADRLRVASVRDVRTEPEQSPQDERPPTDELTAGEVLAKVRERQQRMEKMHYAGDGGDAAKGKLQQGHLFSGGGSGGSGPSYYKKSIDHGYEVQSEPAQMQAVPAFVQPVVRKSSRKREEFADRLDQHYDTHSDISTIDPWRTFIYVCFAAFVAVMIVKGKTVLTTLYWLLCLAQWSHDRR